ncbi:hypothetical protein GGI05_005828, partial [Coemansia sp. RSA 2603]
ENKLMFDEEGRAAASKKLEELQEQFIKATTDWTDAKESGDDDKFSEASSRRMELSDQIKAAALEKDKYTRARHFYTRTGVLDGTVVDWSKLQVPGDSAD